MTRYSKWRWTLIAGLGLVGLIGLTGGCRASRTPAPQASRSEADRLALTGRRQFDAGDMERAIRSYRRALESAQTADDRGAIPTVAANMAVALGAAGQWAEALDYARLAGVESAEATVERWTAELIEARIRLALGEVAAAVDLADGVWLAPGLARHPRLRAEAGVLTAELLLARDRGEAARDRLNAVREAIPDDASFALWAAWHGADGRLAMQADRWLDAAAAFDRQASSWRDAGRYGEMAQALEAGGDAWLAAERPREAADRYTRAGRSLSAVRPEDARRLLAVARDLAETLGDEALLRRTVIQP